MSEKSSSLSSRSSPSREGITADTLCSNPLLSKVRLWGLLKGMNIVPIGLNKSAVNRKRLIEGFIILPYFLL